MTDISLLIEQYDSTFKEIQELQTVFSSGLLLNEGLMANLGKAWNVFKQDSRFDKYTNQIQSATKADDEKIKLALDIVKRKLESRQKALDGIQSKIEKHSDPELVKRLEQAMADNKKQAQTFITAADTLLNTIYPKKPQAAPAPAATPAAAAAAAAPAVTPAPAAAPAKAPSKKSSKPLKQKKKTDMDAQTADPNQRELDKNNPEFEETVKK
jgi:hypothetical protein